MPLVPNRQPRYQAYMLRLWETRSARSDRPSTWRFSLEDVETRQKFSFPDMRALVAFLRARMEQDEDEPAPFSPAER
jgi:hypothetical protein